MRGSLCLLSILICVLGTGRAGASPNAQLVQPGDLIVQDQGPNCPEGGPIFRLSGGGISVLAQGTPLRKPRGSAVDATDNLIVADELAGLLRVDLRAGAVTAIAARPPHNPRDVAIDRDGNYVVVDIPLAVRFISPGPPAVYRVAPDGTVTLVAQGAPLVQPHGVAIDPAGSYIVADTGAGVLRVTRDGQISRVAAPGGLQSPLRSASDVQVDAAGDYIVADFLGGALHRISPDGAITTIRRGPPFSSLDFATRIGGPRGVAIDGNGNFIVADERANGIFRVTPAGEISTIYAGAPMCAPADVTVFRPVRPEAPPPDPIVSPEVREGPAEQPPAEELPPEPVVEDG